MPSILDSIKAEADKAKVDIRTEFPKLMAALGVNTENEHEVFHGVLIWLAREMAKSAPAVISLAPDVESVATEIASVL